jgi:hypothetical protein
MANQHITQMINELLMIKSTKKSQTIVVFVWDNYCYFAAELIFFQLCRVRMP